MANINSIQRMQQDSRELGMTITPSLHNTRGGTNNLGYLSTYYIYKSLKQCQWYIFVFCACAMM